MPKRDAQKAGLASGRTTVGKLTARIANKHVRSEAYAELKHAKKVCSLAFGSR